MYGVRSSWNLFDRVVWVGIRLILIIKADEQTQEHSRLHISYPASYLGQTELNSGKTPRPGAAIAARLLKYDNKMAITQIREEWKTAGIAT